MHWRLSLCPHREILTVTNHGATRHDDGRAPGATGNREAGSGMKTLTTKPGLRPRCETPLRAGRGTRLCGRPAGHEGYCRSPESIERVYQTQQRYDRKRYAEDAEWRAERRLYQRTFMFDMTPDEYEELLRYQRHRCGLCQTDLSELPQNRVGIDHDHGCCPGAGSCGKCVRSILCAKCNVKVSRFETGHVGEKTQEWVVRIRRYLKNPPARRWMSKRMASRESR